MDAAPAVDFLNPPRCEHLNAFPCMVAITSRLPGIHLSRRFLRHFLLFHTTACPRSVNFFSPKTIFFPPCGVPSFSRRGSPAPRRDLFSLPRPHQDFFFSGRVGRRCSRDAQRGRPPPFERPPLPPSVSSQRSSAEDGFFSL